MKISEHIYDRTTVQPGIVRLAPQSSRRILDLGGGLGGNGALIKTLTGASYLCLADLNELALVQAAENVDATIQCNIDEEGSLEKVFAEHGPFDLVLLLDVLEHLYDPWRAIARLHALLEPGSHLLASIPNIQNYRAILWTLTGSWRYRDRGLLDRTHLRFFSRKSAVELMTCSGLQLVGIDKGLGSLVRDRLVDKLSLGIFSRFITLQNQFLVRRDPGPVVDPGFCGSTNATI